METFEQARKTIHTELISDDSSVRDEYMKHFGAEVNEFADVMANVVLAWREIDSLVNGEEKRGYVSALAYAAFTLHLISFKVFLSGNLVAAGNLTRQVVETIALALLCADKSLDVLPRFMEDKYSTNDAVRDVLRHGKRLGLKEEGLQALKSAQNFYHKYSHVSRLTLANLISFSEEGTYVGAAFDNGKLEAYRKETDGRLSLAKVLPNLMQGLKAQLEAW